MSVLALPSEETVFWVLALVVGLVVVVGVLALVTTMLYMVRSISLSVAQLRELTGAQAAAQVAQARAGQPQPPEAEPESGSAEPSTTGTPADDAPPDPGTAAGGGDARDSEPGRRTEE